MDGQLARRAPAVTLGYWRGAWIPVLGSVLLLGWLAYEAWIELYYTFGSNKILHSVSQSTTLAPALVHAVGRYLLTLVLLHVALGLVAHALGRASCTARGADPRRAWRIALAWLAAFTACTWVVNAVAFPASEFAPRPESFLGDVFAGRQGRAIAAAATGFLILAIVVVVAGALWRTRAATSARTGRRAAFAALAACTAVGALLSTDGLLGRADALGRAVDSRPHVILIGIDSLRCDATRLAGNESLTPNIDRFLAGATAFSDATTPLARTFPSWVSILSGRHPVNSGARFNLIPRDHVDASDTLGSRLRAAGYRSVYATDEVRFANIDASYGFDRTIAPPIGAADFTLGELNDFPLTNLLASTRLGAFLFPHTHANRAAYVTYEPAAFVGRLDRELSVDGPTFLAVHLTLAHWPYSWAGRDMPTTPPEYRSGYVDAARVVDTQFEHVLQVLERKGLLRNAIVVLLSDHGEALGRPGDTYVRGFADAEMIWNSVWGHGTSVLSPHQFTVMLAFRRYGEQPFATAGRVLATPASLEDIRPTLLDALGLPIGERVDGLSLRGMLDGGAGEELAARLRYTETDFNTNMVLKGKYEKNGVLREGAAYYDVDPDSGWVQLKPGRLEELNARKERAVFSSRHLLAAVPHRSGPGREYLLIDRARGLPQRLESRPGDPDAARLWDALHERFRGELN